MQKRKKVAVFLLALTMILSGCSPLNQKEGSGNWQSKGTEYSGKESSEFVGMEDEANLNYDVPKSVPGIMVDLLGYHTESAKLVLFQGEHISEQFRVIDEDGGLTVFIGMTEQKAETEEKEAKEQFAYGDFSELTKPGTYYIEADTLGRSYSFEIRDDIYDDLFGEVCKQYYYNRCGMTLTREYAGEKAHNACHTANTLLKADGLSIDTTGGWHQDEKGQKKVVEAARAMTVMLLSYELYRPSFSDQVGIPESGNGIPDLLDELKYEVDWLLKMQDPNTGAVYSGVTVYDKGTNGNSDSYIEDANAQSEEAFAFALALAGFSYLYQEYDITYATTCLKAADRAYKHAKLYPEKGKADLENLGLHFAAAAELYRASGQATYQKEVNDFLQSQETTDEKSLFWLKGNVTYLSTKQPVSRTMCEQIMKELMNRAENISTKAKSGRYLVAEDQLQNPGELLLDMAYLTVVNHIIRNYEYETIVENHLHYFLGRNSNAGEMTSQDIMNRFDESGMLIFMLSGIYYNCHHLTGM